MKIGIITKYNGKYGTIKTEDIEVDFEAKDISLGIDLKEGDKVIFRVEKRTSIAILIPRKRAACCSPREIYTGISSKLG